MDKLKAKGLRFTHRLSMIDKEVEVFIERLDRLGEKGFDGKGWLKIEGSREILIDGESYNSRTMYRGPAPEGDDEIAEETGLDYGEIWANAISEYATLQVGADPEDGAVYEDGHFRR